MSQIYRVVLTDSIYNLQDKVDDMLATGWRCQGGITCHIQPVGRTMLIMYAQALIKNDVPQPQQPDQPLSEMII